MPSELPEPTIEELREAFFAGLRVNDRYGDARDGAIYDHFGGVAAIHWARQAHRDTDLFNAIYIGTAEGKDLTNLLFDRAGFVRVEDSYGIGTAQVRRPTTLAGAGTIWKGTRIVVKNAMQNARRYVVTADVPVGAGDEWARVPLRADRPGLGVAIEQHDEATTVGFEDLLWDNTWAVQSLSCAEGTAFEPAPQARARYRDSKRDARVGFVESIVQACRDAGAANAILFPSNYAGDDEDVGLNMAYVGDAGFSGSPALVRKVQIALESWRVLGDNLQVRPLATTNLVIRANATLWDRVSRVSQLATIEILRGALVGYFQGASGGFSYDRDAMAGAMLRASSALQSVEFELPASDAGVVSTVGGRPNFPATLTRYQLRREDITIKFV